ACGPASGPGSANWRLNSTASWPKTDKTRMATKRHEETRKVRQKTADSKTCLPTCLSFLCLFVPLCGHSPGPCMVQYLTIPLDDVYAGIGAVYHDYPADTRLRPAKPWDKI